MAFSSVKLSRISGGASAANGVTVYCYKDTATDNLATISGSGYFNGVTNIRVGDIIFVEGSDGRDVYSVTATGTVTVEEYNTSTTTVADGSITTAKLANDAVTADKLANNSVDTSALQANAVTEGKLATAVSNKLLAVDAVDSTHIAANAVDTAAIANGAVTGVKMATGLLPLSKQLYTTTGGSASEDVSIGGVSATDIVLATLHTVGSTPRQLDRAVCAAGKVTLHFSDDPSNDHKVNLLVYRP